MAYCRRGRGSDVYLFLSTEGHMECCMCELFPDGNSLPFGTYSHTLQHLSVHKTMGHKVPMDAIKRLLKEQEKYGDDVNESLRKQRHEQDEEDIFPRNDARQDPFAERPLRNA